MASSPKSKIQEGDKLVAEAEKCLKTSWLKWNPDYDGASHAFDKAALCYRNAKAYDKARDAYERAADIYYKNHAIFQSGKALEQAANVCRDMKALGQAAEFLERASAHYHESGHGDTAGQVLTKAAKLVEVENPRKAARYHLSTAVLHETEEKFREAANAVKRAVNMWARARDFDQLLETLQRLRQLYEQLQFHRHCCEVASIEILAHLHNDDTVAATEVLNAASGIPGFAGSDEAPVLDGLIEAFKEGDGDAIQQSCDHAVFRTMDNEIAKLARDLKNKFTFSAGSPTGAAKPKSQAPKSQFTAAAPQKLSDMRAELFGGSAWGSSGKPRKKRVSEERDRGSDMTGEEGSRYSEGGSESTVETLLEGTEEEVKPKEPALSEDLQQLNVAEGSGGEGEEETEEGGEEDNPYGGMLT